VKVSFTGTREGMSAWQKQQLVKFLEEHRNQVALFAHGACSGADVEAHYMVRDVCGSSTFIAVFPSTAKTRVHVQGADYVADPKPPLERDRDIVDCGCDLLLAAPLQMSEVLRSGTWSTIRYARKKHVPVQVMWRE
jgi:hypothetical protein